MVATREQWREALRAADHGRPNAFADLVEVEGIPPFARELAADFIRRARFKNTGRVPEKRTATGNTAHQEKQADAYERFHRLMPELGEEEALRMAACVEAPPTRLRLIVQNKVTPINELLKRRGSYVTGVRFSEAFKN